MLFRSFTPFLILTEEHGEEIIRYNRNQEKFDWRMRNKVDTRWQLSTKAEWADCIRRLLDARRAVPLGPAAMETLTVIAYNQPVSRAFIEQVRGVDSSSSVTSLLEKGLIEEAGRLDLPGRPVSFRTTDVFLRCFGLSSLADLPPVHSAEDETTKTEEANE